MKSEELFKAGKIIRTFGSKGELIFQFESGLPDEVTETESVFVDIHGSLIPFFIASRNKRPKNQVQIQLLDINSPEEAELLCGCNFYIPKDQLPEHDTEHLYSYEIEGFTVIDPSGKIIGTVLEVVELPQQDMLMIDNQGSEIMIPLVDDIIISINRRKKTISVNPPEGLLELNN